MPEIWAGRSKEQYLDRGYFVIQMDIPGELDLVLFDKMAKNLATKDSGDNYHLNFIVASDAMFVFSGTTPFNELLTRLVIHNSLMDLEEVRCAGRLRIDAKTGERSINGYSEEFAQRRLLSIDSSNDYKDTLPSLLGAGFKTV